MAESFESPTASPDVIRMAAPLLFGPLFNWALYGALCVQIYVYSYNFPNDRRPLKILAYFVFLLETIQTALTGSDVYYWLIAGFGDVDHLAHSHFGGIDIGVMTAFISLIVQGYFCYRIWVLNDKQLSWTCWIIAVCALTQSSAMAWLGIKSRIVGNYVVSDILAYLWSIPSALADILIAVAMTLLLRRASGNFSSFVLIRVVRLTIETNTLTAVSAIMILVLYAAFPNEVYFMFLTEIIGKLYSNTLLVNLNNRIYFREHEPPGLGDNACLTVSNRIRAMALSSLNLRVVVPEPQTQASKGVIFPLDPISQPGSLDYTSSNDLSPPNPTSRISLTPPQDLEWRAGTSPHFCGSQEEISS